MELTYGRAAYAYLRELEKVDRVALDRDELYHYFEDEEFTRKDFKNGKSTGGIKPRTSLETLIKHNVIYVARQEDVRIVKEDTDREYINLYQPDDNGTLVYIKTLGVYRWGCGTTIAFLAEPLPAGSEIRIENKCVINGKRNYYRINPYAEIVVNDQIRQRFLSGGGYCLRYSADKARQFAINAEKLLEEYERGCKK